MIPSDVAELADALVAEFNLDRYEAIRRANSMISHMAENGYSLMHEDDR